MFKKTKIVCTMGPACDDEVILEEMMLNGMNVARFNFSHGTHEEQFKRLQTVDKLRKKLNLPVATLFDSKGPEIRFRLFENGKVIIKDKQLFTLTTEEILGTSERASISYKDLIRDVSIGTTILVNDGAIELRVEDITNRDIVTRVIHGGPLSDRKSINVPDIHLSMPFISETDKRDLEFAMENGFEFFALSFVRCAEDVLEVRRMMKEHGCYAKIISKIENKEGVENLDKILEVSDGIMVARGDMGVEIPYEKVPVIQKEMINKCEAAGKYVIVATQMLESMITNPRPTRAEVNDIANAIFDKSSAIMLSGETAAGKYPVEAVKAMNRVAKEIEGTLKYTIKSDLYDEDNLQGSIAEAACIIAKKVKADAIISLSLSGSTIRKVSALRPDADIIGCSVSKKVCYETSLMWGVTPLYIERKDKEEDLMKEVIYKCKKAGFIKDGNRVVIVAGFPLGIPGTTNTIKVIEC